MAGHAESPFKALSNAGEGSTRNVLWQLEQIRGAIAALWPWMKTELSKPMLVIAAKDEETVRSLAPEYWERRGSVHPASVWVTAPDQHYMLIRTDLRGNDTNTSNPYTTAYFSYASLILNSSTSADSASDPNALIAACQKNDAAACAQLAPIAEKTCGDGEKRACLLMTMLQFRGSGVPKDEARALASMEQLCDGGLFEAARNGLSFWPPDQSQTRRRSTSCSPRAAPLVCRKHVRW